MINVFALQPFGTTWPAQKLQPDIYSPEPLQQFCKDNGFEYLGALGENYTSLGYDATMKPAWMRELASVQVHGLRGTIEGYPITMFIDRVATSYSGGEGSPIIPYYSSYGMVVVELSKVFPQLILDSNKNDKLLLKIRSANIKQDQRINLEGNFADYFDFYAPRGINANSLTVLAPNFMQMLIDASSVFDVEIYGNRMFIMTQDPLYTTRVMEEAMQALNEQLRYMHRLEQSWNYQPLVPPFDTLRKTTLGNFYSLKVGHFRIGLIQIIFMIFAAVTVCSWIFL